MSRVVGLGCWMEEGSFSLAEAKQLVGLKSRMVMRRKLNRHSSLQSSSPVSWKKMTSLFEEAEPRTSHKRHAKWPK
eukprot:3195188-Amphidinium_carterae.1